jgi:hypothetical protein
MRRRPVDFRRPVRRRVSNVLWWVLSGIAVLLFIFVPSKETQVESRPEIPKVKKRSLFGFLFISLDLEILLRLVCRPNVGKFRNNCLFVLLEKCRSVA